MNIPVAPNVSSARSPGKCKVKFNASPAFSTVKAGAGSECPTQGLYERNWLLRERQCSSGSGRVYDTSACAWGARSRSADAALSPGQSRTDFTKLHSTLRARGWTQSFLKYRRSGREIPESAYDNDAAPRSRLNL
jgi:hypothetical protein